MGNDPILRLSQSRVLNLYTMVTTDCVYKYCMGKKYKRCFTFGCSFTEWNWPTWADIIAYQTNMPVYNGGLMGLGNVGILHRIVEYDLKYHFNSDDLILVMWTTWSREDRYLNGEWQAHGSVFNNHLYDKNFLKKYWSWENDIIKNASAIILANRSYQIADNYSMLNYGDIEHYKEIRTTTPLFEQYTKNFPKITCVDTTDNTHFFGKSNDGHPDILWHITFYNTYIADTFNFPKVTDTSELLQWQQAIADMLPDQSSFEQNNLIHDFFKDKSHLFSKK